MRRVLVTVPDQGGCGHYRAKWPAEAAKEAGADVGFLENINLNVQGNKIVGMEPPECDVIVMSRPLRNMDFQMVACFQHFGIKVVIDIDDDLGHIDPGNVTWATHHPKANPESNWTWLAKCCKRADLVTVTTPKLAQVYATHGRFRVLPNRVPRRFLDIEPEKQAHAGSRPVIGWPGVIATHPRDLFACGGGVADALRELNTEECGALFRNIGSGEGVREQLGLGDLPFEATGTVPFHDYPAAVAELSVGIVPLADTRFNHAKSALKGLEMAAVGVPFVASRLPDYERVNKDGLGVIADRPRAWKRAILDCVRHRDEISEEGKAVIREKHTYEANAEAWIDAWEAA